MTNTTGDVRTRSKKEGQAAHAHPLVSNEPAGVAPSFRAEYYEVDEFASEIGRTKETVWRWWREGRGPPYVMLGRLRIIPRTGAREWLRSLQVQPPRGGWGPR